MKKVLLALAALSLSTAHAQSSVTIYGLLDLGVVNAKNVGAANGSSTHFLTHPMDTSRLGFRGEEDLGGGLKSGFQLESSINVDDGSQGTSASSGVANATFSRGANVYLSSTQYGRVTIGRFLNPAYSAFLVGEARPGKNFGGAVNIWNDGSSFGGTSTAKTGISSFTGTTFISDAFRLDTPVWKGFQGTVVRSLGGVAGENDLGNINASRRTQYIANYNRGNFGSAVGYQTATNATGVTVAETTTVGARYKFNKLTMAGGWANFNNPNASAGSANTDFDLYQVSGLYETTAKTDISLGYYDLKDNVNGANGAKMYTAIGYYHFSKRTAAYAGYSVVDNRGASGFAAYGGGLANLNTLTSSAQLPSVMQSAGQRQDAYVVGLTHRF